MTESTGATDGLKHYVAPAGVAAPPLSFAVRVGELLFVSGIPGFDEGGRLPDGFDAQFANVMINIRDVLSRAGTNRHRVVKVGVFLTRASDVAHMNELYAEAFAPAPYPARTTCVVHALPNPKMLIEIECIVDMRDL